MAHSPHQSVIAIPKKIVTGLSKNLAEGKEMESYHGSGQDRSQVWTMFPRRLQFPIPVGLNLLMMLGEHG
jgi:hypothetical protein